jgi:hypothetical protein
VLLLVLIGAACNGSGSKDTRGMCAFARTTKRESLVDVKRDWAAAAAKYPHADSRLLSAAQLIDKAVISERALNLKQWNAAPPLISTACGFKASQYGLISALSKLDTPTTAAP